MAAIVWRSARIVDKNINVAIAIVKNATEGDVAMHMYITWHR